MEGGTADPPVHVLSWNVGGLTSAKALEVILALRRGRIHPFANTLVVLLQEVMCDPGKFHLELGELQMLFGKGTEDWRGNAVVHTANLRHSRGKVLPSAVTCVLTSEELRFSAASLHIPHHATLSQTEQILQQLEPHSNTTHKAVLGVDANETFSEAHSSKQISAHTARGELLLHWFEAQELHFPQQALHLPSHFPYNNRLEARRLDHVLSRHLLCDQGEVLQQRDIATSDHEPIAVPLTVLTRAAHRGHPPSWTSRSLRPGGKVKLLLEEALHAHGDPLQQIQKLAVNLTETRRRGQGFKESNQLKQLRRDALQEQPGGERRNLWKSVRKLQLQEQRAWKKLAMRKIAEQDWNVKKVLVETSRDHSWEMALTEKDDWKTTLRLHFEGIFHKQKPGEVATRIKIIMHRLSYLCKNTPWKPFTMEDLYAIRLKWKNGKSCGPDMVSHEALKAMLPHPVWGERLRELFNDMLYTARITENMEASVTVLLAKVTQPTEWGDTRPITLSSVLLKSFGQLLLRRSGDVIQTPARLQWCRRGRQGIELIMILRRIARMAHDWGLEFYIAKLDIRKAFDSVFQESLAQHVSETVGERGGHPWEARAWVSLLHAEKIAVQVAGEDIPIRQSNGVRQGAPESPVAFGALVAKDPDTSITAAKRSKPCADNPPPEDGGSYMDDNYIWSTSKHHLQQLLRELSGRLPRRGLHLHPVKTDIIHNSEEKVTFDVAGQTVAAKGPNHVIQVLGSPLSFHGGTAMLVAEMQARARKAFWAHREAFTSGASLRDKLKLHVILVRQSALWACQTWPCHTSLLKAVNTVQLAQIRTMLGLKRQPTEEWATWNKRSLRRCRLALFHSGGIRWSSFVLSQIWTAIGHICRGDPVGRQIFCWRSLAWCDQRAAGIPIKHAARFNAFMDIDGQLSNTAGKAWADLAQDRSAWARLEEVFVSKYDVLWSSGKQSSLSNLAPNSSQNSDEQFLRAVLDEPRPKHKPKRAHSSSSKQHKSRRQKHSPHPNNTSGHMPGFTLAQAYRHAAQTTRPADTTAGLS